MHLHAWTHPGTSASITMQAMVTAAPLVAGAPAGHFLLGHLLDVSRDQLGFLLTCQREYGDYVALRFGRRPITVLNNPHDVEEVLVTQHRNFVKGYFYRLLGPLLGNGLLTSEGEFWLRQRRLAQPAFHRERISSYAETMLTYTHELLAGWSEGTERDVHHDMMRLTLRVVGKTLFDTDFESAAPDIGESLGAALQELSAQMIGPEFLLPGAIPTPSRLRLRRAVQRLDPFVLSLVSERRRSGEDRGDLLSALLRARDDDGSGMTDRQLKDEAMTIVMAGHETTALALSWTWYLLAQHPEAEQRLAAELADVLQGRPPRLEDVSRLPFTNAVLLETMRLYPPIFGIGRESIAACDLNGYRLPARTNVYMVPYVIQRDPRYFAEPERFWPERWLDGLAQRLPRFAYFPFGGGPRLCIGQPFAMLEGALILSTIAQHWRLHLADNQRVEMRPALTLRLKHGLRMRVERRTN